MTFWSANNVEPTRQYRFTVSDGTDVWWWAKSIEKPSFDIDSQEHKLINHKFKYPGVITWNDIKISIVDTGAKVDQLYKKLKATYALPTSAQESTFKKNGIEKNRATLMFEGGGGFTIHQIDSEGKILEEWELKNPWVKSVSFGTLDYSSDELVTIDITVTYDWANLTN